jgi:ribosomal protein S18 acetylase RimI-like enzyme
MSTISAAVVSSNNTEISSFKHRQRAALIEQFDRTRHNTEEVKNLLAMALGPSSPERLRKLLDNVYDLEGYLLFVTLSRGKVTGPVIPHLPLITGPVVTGIIGIDDSASPHGWILHLAVHPDYRKQEIGRSLISQAMELFSFTSVGLETDQDAVNFYRACGFTATEIHSKWPGVHRFRCTRGNQPESVLEYYNQKKIPE